MSYCADKQVIDTHTDTHTDRYTDRGDDNTRRPKLASGNKNYSSTSFGAILLCTFTPNIGMIGWKLWGSLLDLKKKVDGRRTARHRKRSTDYVRIGAKKGLNLLKHIHLYENSFSWSEQVEFESINYKSLLAFNSNFIYFILFAVISILELFRCIATYVFSTVATRNTWVSDQHCSCWSSGYKV